MSTAPTPAPAGLPPFRAIPDLIREHARARPQHLALRHGTQRMAWGEMDREVDGIAVLSDESRSAGQTAVPSLLEARAAAKVRCPIIAGREMGTQAFDEESRGFHEDFKQGSPRGRRTMRGPFTGLSAKRW